jgi:DNA-binding transcriptional LysR family regulator
MSYASTVMTDVFSKNGVSLERLRSLERVVRAGSIALAAKGDPIAQSLISRQLGELEKVMGFELLDRSKKPYAPTAAGQRLAGSCARFVREVEEAAMEAQGQQRPIAVGAGELVIRQLLIPWIGKKHRATMAHSWSMQNLTSSKVQEGLEAERLDIGIATGLESTGNVEVVDLESYGVKLVLPQHQKPDKTGWNCLTNLPLVVLGGDGKFRSFLADCEREHVLKFKIAAICTSYPQAVDLAEATGSAVFVPEYWWRRHKEWASRTQVLPGQEKLRRTLQLGWNRKVAERRTEVAALIAALKKR